MENIYKKALVALVCSLLLGGFLCPADASEMRNLLGEKQLAELREQTMQMYLGLDDVESISEEVETPHTAWLKPSANGKIKTLYMVALRNTGVADTLRRNVIECAQRLDLDYVYLPLLKHATNRPSVWTTRAADDLDEYIFERARIEINKNYELIVVDGLDCQGVQPEFFLRLEQAVRSGKGVVFNACKNLPQSIQNLLKEQAVELPQNFYAVPLLADTQTLEEQLPLICQLAQAGSGRLAVVNNQRDLSPSIPETEKEKSYYNIYGRTLPLWEYSWFPLLKSMRWTHGKPSPTLDRLEVIDGDLVAVVDFASHSDPLHLEITCKDIYNQVEAVKLLPLKRQSGIAEEKISLTGMRGGKTLFDCRLLNSQGEGLDFGSYFIELPQTVVIEEVNLDKESYHPAEKLKVQVKLRDVPGACKLVVKIEDTLRRLIVSEEKKLEAGQTTVEFSLSIENPLTILHNLFIEICKDTLVLASEKREFSMPFSSFPNDDFLAYQWDVQELAFPRWKEIGMDSVIAPFPRSAHSGLMPALNNLNLRPFAYGSGSVGVRPSHKKERVYTGPDLVREPCFSDPEYLHMRHEALLTNAPPFNYQGAVEHLMADEFHLGPKFCFSEHCLRNFREYLKEQYTSLDQLNNVWETNYSGWEEITPLTLEEVHEGAGSLPRWLDHRMFMNLVFVRWVKHTKQVLRESNPEVTIGLSGPVNPDTTYNWQEFLKITDFLANYGGIQNSFIKSFQMPEACCGQWTGYTWSWVDAERYVCTGPWDAVFNKRRACFYWHGGISGYGIFGDLRVSRSMARISREIKELKRGTAKLLFNVDEIESGAAIHYSQNSMFAAMATIGVEHWNRSIDSWRYLFSDIGLNAQFVSYEQLAKDGLDVSKIRVFILPFSLSLSKLEVENLKKFVENGGTLIADWAPGLYDEHGQFSADHELLDLFGIKRREKILKEPAVCELRVREDAGFGFAERNLQLLCGESGLILAGGQAYADTGNPDLPAVIVKQTGKGKAILLNCAVSDYAVVELSGQGGEVETLYRGSPSMTAAVRGLLEDIAEQAGLKSRVRLTDADGKDHQPGTLTVSYASGLSRYIGILQPVLTVFDDDATNAPSDYVAVTVQTGVKGHIYNIRSGKYLGAGDLIQTTLAPGIARLFAVLPYQVTEIALPKGLVCKPGATAQFPISIKTDSGTPGFHVVRVEVIAPDKSERPAYAQNVKLIAGSGVFEMPTALNDEPGVWQLTAKDVATGVIAKSSFTIEP